MGPRPTPCGRRREDEASSVPLLAGADDHREGHQRSSTGQDLDHNACLEVVHHSIITISFRPRQGMPRRSWMDADEAVAPGGMTPGVSTSLAFGPQAPALELLPADSHQDSGTNSRNRIGHAGGFGPRGGYPESRRGSRRTLPAQAPPGVAMAPAACWLSPDRTTPRRGGRRAQACTASHLPEWISTVVSRYRLTCV